MPDASSGRASDWDFDLGPDGQPLLQSIREIADYRDLLWTFVRRDIVAVYKQTLLGPLWIVLQPILTTAIYAVVFGEIARIETDGIPHLVFYLCGVTFWGLFSKSLTSTAHMFVSNEHLFSKVYFPRLVSVLSSVLTHGFVFLVQIVIFLAVYGIFYSSLLWEKVNLAVLLIPVYLFVIVVLSTGLGLIVAASTVRYRDLRNLVGFGVQLLMFATPVIYPFANVPASIARWLRLNPLVPAFEGIQAAFFDSVDVAFSGLVYAVVSSLLVLVVGLSAFGRVERKFVDEI